MIVYGNDLIAGKIFTTAGSTDVAHIAKWNEPANAVTDVGNIPANFKLYQNYPNPFNPHTTIMYELSTTNHIKLTIIDVLGKEVATLVNGTEGPGYKSFNVNSDGLASGIYYYRLETTSISQTKKLLLIR